MKLWGGRFETGPSEIFERFSNSLHFDRRLLDADVRVDLPGGRAQVSWSGPGQPVWLSGPATTVFSGMIEI